MYDLKKKGPLALASLIASLVLLATIGLKRQQLLDSKRRGQEAVVVASLRSIHASQQVYIEHSESNRYGDFRDLVGTMLIDELLLSGTRDSYRFEIALQKGQEAYFYSVTANPIQPDHNKRSFYTDQSGVVRYSDKGSAGPNSPVWEKQ